MTLLVSSIIVPLLGAAAATAPDCVYISEVAYDVAEEATDEWVELVNLSDGVVSLDELRVGDEETLGGTEAILQFPIGATIEPWGNVVVATNAARFSTLFGFEPDFEVKDSMASVAKMSFDRSLGGARFELANTTDEIVLLDAQGLLLDGVSWGRASSPLPGIVNAATVTEGKTLVRPFNAAEGPQAWRSGTPAPGIVTITGLSTAPVGGEGEGEGEAPVGEGEGEGEGEGPRGEGEGEDPVGEGEGEDPVGEGEGEDPVDPAGEGEGEPIDPVGEGEGEDPVGGHHDDDGTDLGSDRPGPVVGPPESRGCTQSGGAAAVIALGALVSVRRRRR